MTTDPLTAEIEALLRDAPVYEQVGNTLYIGKQWYTMPGDAISVRLIVLMRNSIERLLEERRRHVEALGAIALHPKACLEWLAGNGIMIGDPGALGIMRQVAAAALTPTKEKP